MKLSLFGTILMLAFTTADDTPMIVGGEDADIEDFPFVCSLRRGGDWAYHICGGAILSGEFAITAAHCIARSIPVEEYSIKTGSSDLLAPSDIYYLTSVTVHENYHRRTYENDIALLKIRGKIVFGLKTAPVPLPDTDFELGAADVATALGWGYTQEGGTVSATLQMVQMPIIERPVCQERYSGYRMITEKMICAGYEEGLKDACQGDSGGPLIVRGHLAGTVSWGKGCARPGFPGVYANIPYFHDWIWTKINSTQE